MEALREHAGRSEEKGNRKDAGILKNSGGDGRGGRMQAGLEGVRSMGRRRKAKRRRRQMNVASSVNAGDRRTEGSARRKRIERGRKA